MPQREIAAHAVGASAISRSAAARRRETACARAGHRARGTTFMTFIA
jgi:hypothetical protein